MPGFAIMTPWFYEHQVRPLSDADLRAQLTGAEAQVSGREVEVRRGRHLGPPLLLTVAGTLSEAELVGIRDRVAAGSVEVVAEPLIRGDLEFWRRITADTARVLAQRAAGHA